jgi:hypothetical protein
MGQKAEGSPGLLGTGVGGGFAARGQSLGESAEVFDEDATGVEISFHDGGLEEMTERAAQAQPVKTGQYACHGMTESVKKGWRNAGAGGRSLLVHHPNFYPNARGSATLVAAEAALSLCVLKYPCSSVVKKFAYAWLWTKSGLLH